MAPGSHASAEKNGAVHEEVNSQPVKGQRFKRTCAKWWWLFFLLFAVIVLVIVLPIVYVAYPKVARNGIANSKIEVLSMEVLNPTPDTVQMGFRQRFLSDSSQHPVLYPFEASFYLLDNPNNPPFATIETAEIKGGNGVETTVPLQTVNITHQSEFTRYVLLSLASENYTIALRGNGELQLGPLPKVSVNYNNNITMAGFNHLSGFTLTSIHILSQTQLDGSNAYGTASIPNPSVQTVDMGKVTLNLSVNGTSIGIATIDHLVLSPGDNQVDLTAVVYQLVVYGLVVDSKSTILPLTISGNQSTSITDGQILPYYTTVLTLLNLDVSLNVSQALESAPVLKRELSLALENSRLLK